MECLRRKNPRAPDQERMDAISGALARMIQRQDAVDQRLLRIEAAMGLLPRGAARA